MVQCTFYRGVCRIHGIKGTKNTISRKVWTKKKFGYGYSTVKKVEWKCDGNNWNLGGTDDADILDLSQSPVGAISRQGGSDILVKGSEVSRFSQISDTEVEQG